MLKFSDRYGYTTPPSVLITEIMPETVQNAICSVFDDLSQNLALISDRRIREYNDLGLTYNQLELSVWMNFLHKRKNDLKIYGGKSQEVITKFLQDNHPWYEKLNLVEFVIGQIRDYLESTYERYYHELLDSIVDNINEIFEELYYGYRIVDYYIAPILDPIEIDSIVCAINDEKDNVHIHLETALSHYARRPNPDYRNSIKESISAIECICREITGESTLDRAIPKLKAKGIQLNPQFEEGIKRMYFYTNDQSVGVRHALLDDTYLPGCAEAKYMLVICSAFVNYIRMLVV